MNAALFPSAAGTSTTFVVRDPGATADRTVTLTSINLSPSPVNRTRVIDTPTGKVGYILFNTFSPFESERAIIQAITELRISSVTDLVLDLRYNGGGLLAVVHDNRAPRIHRQPLHRKEADLLDEGEERDVNVEQIVERVDHTFTPEKLAAAGRDSECRALASAVKFHIERRVFLNGSKTVVFR